MIPKTEKYWIEDHKDRQMNGIGIAYTRNDLFKFVKRIEADGNKVIGIELEEGSWNLGLIVEEIK